VRFSAVDLISREGGGVSKFSAAALFISGGVSKLFISISVSLRPVSFLFVARLYVSFVANKSSFVPARNGDDVMLSVASTCLYNILLSVGLIIANKSLVVNFQFKYTVFLSCLHFITSMLCTFMMVYLGFVMHKPATNYLHVIRISVVGPSK
jgi:hypothetical protein